MITFSEVTKTFGQQVAVDRISLTIDRGEIFGLVGPDGAGKTTAIRMMTGVLEASAGRIELLGSGSLEAVKSDIGYVPQKFSLYRDLTVLENIRLIGSLYGAAGKAIEQLAEEMLSFTGLWPFRHRLSENLSGGMKQKLALAAGLMHKPNIFFLDEPTTGVDPVSRREFWQMLYRLNQEGMTIVAATPYMDEAELCSRVAFMDQGKIVACASPQQLRERYPHRILELKVDGKGIKTLLKAAPILEINSFGDKYHLVVADAEQARYEVEKALQAAGKPIRILQEVQPNLEDIFVALAGGGGQGD
jgi:ABC-2 type transport system ATP-binding protein